MDFNAELARFNPDPSLSLWITAVSYTHLDVYKRQTMNQPKMQTVKCAALTISVALMSVSSFAADRIEGRVKAGGAAISGADVTLWLAGPGVPQKLAEAKTNDDGSYDLLLADGKGDAGVLYLIAAGGESKLTSGKGPNPAITLMATLGTKPPERVTINELTTVASAWTLSLIHI